MALTEYCRGFTYIEILLALALFGLSLSFTALVNTDALTKTHVREERDMFVSTILLYSRARALANVHGASQGIYIDVVSRSYVLFEGNVFDKDAPENRSVPFQHDDITISTPDEDGVIIFDALTARVEKGAGTYTLSRDTTTTTVTINVVGGIEW